jgi:Tfp pilus assembly protein PilX
MNDRRFLKSLNNQNGAVLVTAILIMSVLVLLGATAVMTTSTDLKIAGHFKTGEQAFYAAEAGIEEARARLRANAASAIQDLTPTDTEWARYIGTVTKSQGKGYNSGNPKHMVVASLQSALDYTVKIVHQTDSAGNLLYWGDANGDGRYERTTSPTNPTGLANQVIYVVTGYGFAAQSNRTVESEMSKVPPITAPAALYVEASTTIQGSSTNVIGVDQCGGASLPGVVTTLAAGTVSKTGNPVVCGATYPCDSGAWDVVGGGTNMDIQSIVNSWRDAANYQYSVSGDTHTGMAWGTPTMGATLQNPSSCSTTNVVYYNTNGTDIKLAGGTSGCGILLVDGDLEVNGGFTWHGMVIVSGSIRYLGGGDKNITGAVLAGGSMDADLVGGNANIVYCSSAINNQSYYQALRKLSWAEKTN